MGLIYIHTTYCVPLWIFFALHIVCSIRWSCKTLSLEGYMPHQLHPSRYIMCNCYNHNHWVYKLNLSDILLRTFVFIIQVSVVPEHPMWGMRVLVSHLERKLSSSQRISSCIERWVTVYILIVKGGEEYCIVSRTYQIETPTYYFVVYISGAII